MKSNKFLLIFLFLVLVSLPASTSWTPQSDIDGRDYYNISGFPVSNATIFYQNGSMVLDISDINGTTFNYSLLSNYSNYANESFYWDNLNTPADILISDLDQTGQADLNVNNSEYWDDETSQADLNVNSSDYWDDLGSPSDIPDSIIIGKVNISEYFQIKVDWSNILNRFITAVDDIYIYMSGTTATFNETKLNETANALLGQPTTLTGATTNQVSSSTHTHEVTADGAGECTGGSICGAGHGHPASQVTAGTFDAGNYVFSGGTVDVDTLNTGQGDNELYAMDQDVTTTDSPEFHNVSIDNYLVFPDGLSILAEGSTAVIETNKSIWYQILGGTGHYFWQSADGFQGQFGATDRNAVTVDFFVSNTGESYLGGNSHIEGSLNVTTGLNVSGNSNFTGNISIGGGRIEWNGTHLVFD